MKRTEIAHLRKSLTASLILVDCPVRCLFVLPPVCCLVQEFEVMTRELMILRYFRNRVRMYCLAAPHSLPQTITSVVVYTFKAQTKKQMLMLNNQSELTKVKNEPIKSTNIPKVIIWFFLTTSLCTNHCNRV